MAGQPPEENQQINPRSASTSGPRLVPGLPLWSPSSNVWEHYGFNWELESIGSMVVTIGVMAVIYPIDFSFSTERQRFEFEREVERQRFEFERELERQRLLDNKRRELEWVKQELERKRWEAENIKWAKYNVSLEGQFNGLSKEYCERQVAWFDQCYSEIVEIIKKLRLRKSLLAAELHRAGQEVDVGSFKTKLCNNWESTLHCTYDPCIFAHGQEELRREIPHPFSNISCPYMLNGVLCPRGYRCCFSHILH